MCAPGRSAHPSPDAGALVNHVEVAGARLGVHSACSHVSCHTCTFTRTARISLSVGCARTRHREDSKVRGCAHGARASRARARHLVRAPCTYIRVLCRRARAEHRTARCVPPCAHRPGGASPQKTVSPGRWSRSRRARQRVKLGPVMDQGPPRVVPGACQPSDFGSRSRPCRAPRSTG